jgi:hypothetical protein
MQTIEIDVKTVARQRGPHQPRHPILPTAILEFTKHWMALSEDRPPAWSHFQMLDVLEVVPYLTVFRRRAETRFQVEFMGSAVSAMLGEDLTGTEFTPSSPTVAEIDWFERCLSATEQRDVLTMTGSANPLYTSRIDFVGADFPFLDEAGDDVSYIVCLTVAKVN